MSQQRIITNAAAVMLLGLLCLQGQAQNVQDVEGQRARPRRTSGILTDRLTSKQAEQWQKLKTMVFAEGLDGKPLVPTLRNLWISLDSSGHSLFVEFPKSDGLTTNTAGSFQLEHFDSNGKHHRAVLRLYLHVIDRAYTGHSAARENGFIPFKGLRKDQRYAEVLGHEFAHALDVFSDLERARVVDELIVQTNEMFYATYTQKPAKPVGAELQQRMSKRDALLEELENHAEVAEQGVWAELLAARTQSQRAQTKP